MKHKHYDCIVAWANGAKIEARFPNGEWQDFCYPSWDGKDIEYRIKPMPKPDVVKIFYLESNPILGLRFSEEINPVQEKTKRIRCTFDGETCILKSVEML